MKIVPAVTFMLLTSTMAQAQEFLPASEEDLMAVTFNFVEESKKIMTEVPKKDCDDDKVVDAPKKIAPEEGKELFCICELGGNGLKVKDAKKIWPIVGEIEYVEGTITTGNDNFLHGAAQKKLSFKAIRW